jgi:hypothetical protein
MTTLKWQKEEPREGSKAINHTVETPFGTIRVCSNGSRAMCTNHPVRKCDAVGREFDSVEEAIQNASRLYVSALQEASGVLS